MSDPEFIDRIDSDGKVLRFRVDQGWTEDRVNENMMARFGYRGTPNKPIALPLPPGRAQEAMVFPAGWPEYEAHNRRFERYGVGRKFKDQFEFEALQQMRRVAEPAEKSWALEEHADKLSYDAISKGAFDTPMEGGQTVANEVFRMRSKARLDRDKAFDDFVELSTLHPKRFNAMVRGYFGRDFESPQEALAALQKRMAAPMELGLRYAEGGEKENGEKVGLRSVGLRPTYVPLTPIVPGVRGMEYGPQSMLPSFKVLSKNQQRPVTPKDTLTPMRLSGWKGKGESGQSYNIPAAPLYMTQMVETNPSQATKLITQHFMTHIPDEYDAGPLRDRYVSRVVPLLVQHALKLGRLEATGYEGHRQRPREAYEYFRPRYTPDFKGWAAEEEYRKAVELGLNAIKETDKELLKMFGDPEAEDTFFRASDFFTKTLSGYVNTGRLSSSAIQTPSLLFKKLAESPDLKLLEAGMDPARLGDVSAIYKQMSAAHSDSLDPTKLDLFDPERLEQQRKVTELFSQGRLTQQQFFKYLSGEPVSIGGQEGVAAKGLSIPTSPVDLWEGLLKPFLSAGEKGKSVSPEEATELRDRHYWSPSLGVLGTTLGEVWGLSRGLAKESATALDYIGLGELVPNGWVADQRNRWNDMYGYHREDIDSRWNKQLTGQGSVFGKPNVEETAGAVANIAMQPLRWTENLTTDTFDVFKGLYTLLGQITQLSPSDRIKLIESSIIDTRMEAGGKVRPMDFPERLSAHVIARGEDWAELLTGMNVFLQEVFRTEDDQGNFELGLGKLWGTRPMSAALMALDGARLIYHAGPLRNWLGPARHAALGKQIRKMDSVVTKTLFAPAFVTGKIYGRAARYFGEKGLISNELAANWLADDGLKNAVAEERITQRDVRSVAYAMNEGRLAEVLPLLADEAQVVIVPYIARTLAEAEGVVVPNPLEYAQQIDQLLPEGVLGPEFRVVDLVSDAMVAGEMRREARRISTSPGNRQVTLADLFEQETDRGFQRKDGQPYKPGDQLEGSPGVWASGMNSPYHVARRSVGEVLSGQPNSNPPVVHVDPRLYAQALADIAEEIIRYEKKGNITEAVKDRVIASIASMADEATGYIPLSEKAKSGMALFETKKRASDRPALSSWGVKRTDVPTYVHPRVVDFLESIVDMHKMALDDLVENGTIKSWDDLTKDAVRLKMGGMIDSFLRNHQWVVQPDLPVRVNRLIDSMVKYARPRRLTGRNTAPRPFIEHTLADWIAAGWWEDPELVAQMIEVDPSTLVRPVETRARQADTIKQVGLADLTKDPAKGITDVRKRSSLHKTKEMEVAWRTRIKAMDEAKRIFEEAGDEFARVRHGYVHKPSGKVVHISSEGWADLGFEGYDHTGWHHKRKHPDPIEASLRRQGFDKVLPDDLQEVYLVTRPSVSKKQSASFEKKWKKREAEKQDAKAYENQLKASKDYDFLMEQRAQAVRWVEDFQRQIDGIKRKYSRKKLKDVASNAYETLRNAEENLRIAERYIEIIDGRKIKKPSPPPPPPRPDIPGAVSLAPLKDVEGAVSLAPDETGALSIASRDGAPGELVAPRRTKAEGEDAPLETLTEKQLRAEADKIYASTPPWSTYSSLHKKGNLARIVKSSWESKKGKEGRKKIDAYWDRYSPKDSPEFLRLQEIRELLKTAPEARARAVAARRAVRQTPMPGMRTKSKAPRLASLREERMPPGQRFEVFTPEQLLDELEQAGRAPTRTVQGDLIGSISDISSPTAIRDVTRIPGEPVPAGPGRFYPDEATRKLGVKPDDLTGARKISIDEIHLLPNFVLKEYIYGRASKNAPAEIQAAYKGRNDFTHGTFVPKMYDGLPMTLQRLEEMPIAERVALTSAFKHQES